MDWSKLVNLEVSVADLGLLVLGVLIICLGFVGLHKLSKVLDVLLEIVLMKPIGEIRRDATGISINVVSIVVLIAGLFSSTLDGIKVFDLKKIDEKSIETVMIQQNSTAEDYWVRYSEAKAEVVENHKSNMIWGGIAIISSLFGLFIGNVILNYSEIKHRMKMKTSFEEPLKKSGNKGRLMSDYEEEIARKLEDLKLQVMAQNPVGLMVPDVNKVNARKEMDKLEDLKLLIDKKEDTEKLDVKKYHFKLTPNDCPNVVDKIIHVNIDYAKTEMEIYLEDCFLVRTWLGGFNDLTKSLALEVSSQYNEVVWKQLFSGNFRKIEQQIILDKEYGENLQWRFKFKYDSCYWPGRGGTG